LQFFEIGAIANSIEKFKHDSHVDIVFLLGGYSKPQETTRPSGSQHVIRLHQLFMQHI
jgi:hypothetical protein